MPNPLLSIRVSPKTKQALEDAATSLGQTPSDLARDYINQCLGLSGGGDDKAMALDDRLNIIESRLTAIENKLMASVSKPVKSVVRADDSGGGDRRISKPRGGSQAYLSARFGVSSSAVQKAVSKGNDYFKIWSQQKDPEGKAWIWENGTCVESPT